MLSLLSNIHLGCELLPDNLGLDTSTTNDPADMCTVDPTIDVADCGQIEILSEVILLPSECQPPQMEVVGCTSDGYIPKTPISPKSNPSGSQSQKYGRVVLGENVRRHKVNTKEEKYTSKFIESAAQSYNDAQESRYKGAVLNAESITALASAIETFAAVYKEGVDVNKEKLEILRIFA